MANKDLNVILHFEGQPVRMGRVDDELMVCVHDLLELVVGDRGANASRATSTVPDFLSYSVTSVDRDGFPANGRVNAATRGAAILLISRVRKVYAGKLIDVINWLCSIDVNKIKGVS